MLGMERDVVKRILGDKPVAYHPIIAKMLKSATAALYFSQMMYWDSTLKEHREGWFWKTQEEMEQETGLTRSEQETARRDLKKRGWIAEKKQGIPYRLWYKIEWEIFFDDVSTYKDAENPQSSMQDSANQFAENLQTITESTPKSTTQNGDSKIEPFITGEPKEDAPIVKEHKKIIKAILSNPEMGQHGAVASPRIAEREYVKTIAPMFAAVFNRAGGMPITEDEQAARRAFKKNLAPEFVEQRIRAYRNGEGEDFRKPEATAFWIVNRLERDRAMVPRQTIIKVVG